MYRIIADYITLGVWGMSMANTITSFDVASASSIAQLVLSILGIVYLAVKITNETLNSTVAEQVNIQGQTLNVGNCVDSDISLNQDIVAEVAATSITKMMSDAIAGNTLLNTMAATADSSATKSQGGIAEIADSVFGGIAGIIGTSQEGAQVASAASVCCVCVLVLGGVAVALSPAGQNAGRAAASKF